MKHARWTKQQLLDEVENLQRRIALLEASEATHEMIEDALSNDGEGYPGFFDRAPIGLFRSTPGNRLLYVNQTLAEMAGYPDAQTMLTHKAADFYVDPQERLGWESVAYELPVVHDHETRLRRRDGSIFWGRVNVRAIRDEEGQVLYYEGSVRDITHRKRIEEQLGESEERYRAVFEGSLDAIFLADPESGHILDANPTCSEMLLLPLEWIVGLHHTQIHPPHLEESSREMFAAFVQDTPLSLPIETAIVRSDGNERQVEIIGQTIQIDGRPHIYMTVRDITQRKRDADALKEAEERWRSMAENSPDYILTLTTDGIMQFINRTFILPRAQVIGKSIYAYLTEEAGRALKECLDGVVRSGAPDSRTLDVLYPDGTLRVYEYRIGPVFGPNGVTGFTVNASDITARKRVEEQLAKVERLESLGVLAGGIAHDFNNFLTAILANVSMAKLYGDLQDDIYQMLTDAETASLRAKTLTQQLLVFARGGSPVRRTTPIDRLLRQATEFVLSGSKLRCQYAFPGDLWLVDIDEGQIAQVIHNLVLNADQAMPEGGTLTVGAENVMVGETDRMSLKPGRYVRVSVTDKGAGIPEKHLHKIFDPFFTTKHRGSGLGLTISFTIVKNHNGYLHVESRVGEGTRCDVYLPASESAVVPQGMHGGHPPSGKGKILLIDDVDIIRRSAGEILKRMGYEVLVAQDGEEGIELYRQAKASGEPVDAVIMDLTIPGGMGGRRAIEKLMALDPHAKVIASSGYSDDPVMSQFREYGFSAAVRKPYNPEELGQTVHHVLMGWAEEP